VTRIWVDRHAAERNAFKRARVIAPILLDEGPGTDTRRCWKVRIVGVSVLAHWDGRQEPQGGTRIWIETSPGTEVDVLE
jgi:hypothetical protein